MSRIAKRFLTGLGRKPQLAMLGTVLLLLAALPAAADWVTISTTDGQVDPDWPAPLYTTDCSNANIVDHMEIRNAWIVNDGTEIAFRIETCNTTTSYQNIRMVAGLDCNHDGDFVDVDPGGDRRIVQIIPYGSIEDEVEVYDGGTYLIYELADHSERVGANFEWRLPLSYLEPTCRGSFDRDDPVQWLGVGLATVQMGFPSPTIVDQTPYHQWYIPLDYGDAIHVNPTDCTGYPTRLNCNAARHGLDSTLLLGSLADPDPGNLQDADATADDLNNEADEDGVMPTLGSNWTANGTGSLDITASDNGYVNCWVDWALNGNWADAGEHVINDTAVVTGTNTLTFAVPTVTFPNNFTARCRIAPAAGQANSVTGAVEFGEVEDYVWAFGATGNRPAPLTLDISLPVTDTVQLDWAPTPSNESYLILRSTLPYFQPGDVTPVSDPDNAAPYSDPGVAGNPLAPATLFYAAQGQVTSSTPVLVSGLSNRVGLFEFSLVPGALP